MDEWNEEKYKLLDKHEASINSIERRLKALKREAEELQNEIEVDEFLYEGPGGKDPK